MFAGEGMSGSDDIYGSDPDPGRVLRVVIPLLIAALLVLIPVIVTSSLNGSEVDEEASAQRAEKLRKLPVYWKVRAGDTYEAIAARTGLTIEELEDFNPRVDPSTIQPGQRLKLRAKVPPPPPKRLGPKWWIVKQGESFGSIAAATGANILVLQRLNPKVKPEKMQPGMRIRLRR